MASGARLLGASDMKKKITSVEDNFFGRVSSALLAEMGIDLLEVYKRTPVLTGELRTTEKLMGPFKNGNSIVVMIVCGGPEAPYAAIVHEDLEAFHKFGQAKYLESVLFESRPFMGQRVSKRLNIAEWVG